MNIKNFGSELFTKETPFEDVYQMIEPMIHYIASLIDGIYSLEIDDIKQELSIQAYCAWGKWEPDRGTKFSTYVFDVLINKKNCLVRAAKAQKRNCGLSPASLDEVIENRDINGSPFCLYEVFADINQNPEELACVLTIWDAVERVLASMQKKEQKAVRALLSGYTQMEISRSVGVNQSMVSCYLKSFRTKVRAELERGEPE